MQHTLLIRFEWGMISLLAACCFVDVSSAVLLFSRYNRNSSAISTNLRCARCEYKILILKCCCFNSSVCVSQSISNGGHFFSSRSTRFYCSAWMHVFCSSIRPTQSLSVCALFRCRHRCCCCWWCWCWYGNFIVRIQCSVLNFVIMLCFYFYSSHLFAKISMCDKMWKKNADADASRFLLLYISNMPSTHTHTYWLIPT